MYGRQAGQKAGDVPAVGVLLYECIVVWGCCDNSRWVVGVCVGVGCVSWLCGSQEGFVLVGVS